VALRLLGRASSIEDAEESARNLWRNRRKTLR
jgi:hypothetical protein